MGRFRHSRADNAMKKTLSFSVALEESLLQEAAAKSFIEIPPVTGANAVPVTSTPTRGSPLNRAVVQEDEVMPQENNQNSDF